MALGIYLGLFMPLASFLFLLLLGEKFSRKVVATIACCSIFISFICFASLLVHYITQGMSPVKLVLYEWMATAAINAHFSLFLDPLSLLMTLIITGIGFLIHVYSSGYIDHEECYQRYFAVMNFFIFSMLLLVLAGDLLLLFVGWEGVGLASYLLIGFWYQRKAAAAAATKAFVVNRVGDLGFLLALLFTFALFHSSDMDFIFQNASENFAPGSSTLIALTLLFFIGAIGKSAQLPLHVWLPDAMEGPTPVSALIHAATMVTAGVYLVVRLHPLFIMAPTTLQVVGIIGAVTSLFAALCAVGQTDLKRVLAYSTVSQLGLMFLACGVGAFYAAMFHLTTHACIKALLFLSAGNVVHMLHGTTEMEKMGGLKKVLPITHWLFLIGVLALSGVPPLAAFFSKEIILEQEHLAGYETLFFVALAASTLTAFYLTRAYCLTFTGAVLAENKAVVEAPKVMLWPVIILAFLSVTGGLLGCCSPLLESFLAQAGVTLAFSNEFLFTRETWLAMAGAFLGIACAAIMYTRYRKKLTAPLRLLNQAFFIDALYDRFIVKPLKSTAAFIAKIGEVALFQGSIDFVASTTKSAATQLQYLQSGQIRSYVGWMVIGTAIFIVYSIL